MGSATIQHLPDEMLREVFHYVTGEDVTNLSKVCPHWQNVVDDLGVEFWRKLCCQEYPAIYEDSQRKSGLSWRDLYRSFSFWERVSEAEVRVTPCPYDHINNFSLNFLKNGLISFPLYQYQEDFADTVIYFDVKSCREVGRKCYGFQFKNYTESDDVIAMEISDSTKKKVRIIPKANEDMSIGFEPYPTLGQARSWLLKGDEIFYNKTEAQDNKVKFCKTKISIKDKEVSYEHNELGDSDLSCVLSVAYTGEKLHVLGSLWGKSKYVTVVTFENRKMKEIYSIHCNLIYDSHMDVCKFMEDLRRYGFRSCDPHRTWIVNESRLNDDSSGTIQSPILYGSHFLAKTSRNGVSIFLNINKAIEDNIADREPFTIFNSGESNGLYDQFEFEVIETLHGHIIVAICRQNLYIIELTHNSHSSN